MFAFFLQSFTKPSSWSVKIVAWMSSLEAVYRQKKETLKEHLGNNMSSSTICCARSFQTNYQKDLCNPKWLHVKNMCMKEMHVRFQDLLSQKHSVKFSESLLKFRVTTCEKREKGSMDEIHVQFQNQLCQSHSVKCLKELPMIQTWACTAFWPAVVRGLQLRNQCKIKWT